MALRLKNPLAYPGRPPGVNPAHPAAAAGAAGVSLIPAPGGAFLNLLTGGFTTKYLTQNYGIGSAGPYIQSNTSNACNTFSNAFSTAPAGITIGGIVTPVASVAGGELLSTNSTSNSLGIQATIRGLVFGYRNSTIYSSGLPAMSIGTPYFIALSCNGTKVYFVQTNLFTGQVSFSVVAAGLSQGSTTTWAIGGAPAIGSTQSGCNIHTLMAGYCALSPAQLMAWAAAPGDFWFPATADALILSALSAPSSGPIVISAYGYVGGMSVSRGAAALAVLGAGRSTALAQSGSAPVVKIAAGARSAAASSARGAPAIGAVASAYASAASISAMRGAAAAHAALAARAAGASSARGNMIVKASAAARAGASTTARGSPSVGASIAAAAGRAASIATARAAAVVYLSAAGMMRALMRAWGTPGVPSIPLVIDPALFLSAPYTIRSLAAPPSRLALPRGAPNVGLPMIWTDCVASTTITTPGAYVAKTAGITLILAQSARGGPVQVKALAIPITVVDALGASFDAGPTTFSLSVLDESVTFTWSAGDSSWLVG